MLMKTVSSHQTADLEQYLEKIFPRSKENIWHKANDNAFLSLLVNLYRKKYHQDSC